MRPSSVLACLLLVASACEYSSQGVYYKKLSSTPTTSVTVDFNNAPDTLLMLTPITMQYAVSGVDQTKPYSISVTINPSTSQTITPNGLNGSFTVNLFASEGYYTLTMKVITSSGTGSLADHTGSEHVVFNKSIVLHYLTKWPISATRYQGRIKVTWPVYKGSDFITYQFYAYYMDSTGTFPISRHRKYADRNSSSFIDSAYVGAGITYNLVIETSGVNSPYGSVSFSDVNPQLANFQFKSNQVIASWTKSKYYNNFLQYNITIGNSQIFTSHKKNINDTTITFSPDFGSTITFLLNTQSQRGGQKTQQSFLWTDPNPVNFSYFTPNRSHNRYYASIDAVNAYDLTTNALMGSIPFMTSQNGYSTTASSPLGEVWVYHNSQFSKVDPGNLTIIKSIDVATVIGTSYPLVHGIGYSDQGVLLCVNSQQIYSYNVNTGTQVATPFFFPYFSFGLEYNFTFSADGRYFTFPGFLFQITGNTISQIGNYYDAIAFDELNSSQLLVYNQSQNSLLIEDIGTQSVLHTYKASFTLPSYSIAQIDPVTKWLLIISNAGASSRLIVYDFVADKMILNAGASIGNVVLYNGVLYSGRGARLKLN